VSDEHTATIGSRIRVYQVGVVLNGIAPLNGIEPADGEQLVTAVTSNSITYITDVPISIDLGVAPQVSIFNDYLREVEVGNFLLFDGNPLAHTQGGEESHGMFITSVINPKVHNIWGQGIGDELVEIIRCEGYNVKNIIGLTSPSVQTGGGGLVSIKNGSWNGVVDTVIQREPFAPGSANKTYVLSIKTAGNSLDMGGIIAKNIIGNYPEFSTVNFSVSGAKISTVVLENITATGGGRAISKGGSFKLSNVDIYNLKATKQTERPVEMTGLVEKVEGIRFHNPQIDGAHLNSVDGELFRLNGTNNRIYNATLSNAKVAFFTNANKGLIIKGGTIDNCGGQGSSGYMIRDVNGGGTIIDGVAITNCQSTIAAFFRVDEIKNCPEIECVASPGAGLMINSKSVENNKKINTYLRVQESGANVMFNEFTRTVGQGANGIIRLSGSNNLVVGNKALNLISGNAIVEDVEQDRNIIRLNNMSGMPYVIRGENTISGDNL